MKLSQLIKAINIKKQLIILKLIKIIILYRLIIIKMLFTKHNAYFPFNGTNNKNIVLKMYK